jgi:hypothetical protein
VKQAAIVWRAWIQKLFFAVVVVLGDRYVAIDVHVGGLLVMVGVCLHSCLRLCLPQRGH